MELSPIFDYRMTEKESRAFKIALLWEKMAAKILPDEPQIKLPKGDPRKSHLFRVAWKFSRESQNVIPDNEIGLYIRAQLEMLKSSRFDDGSHPHIDPMVLCGKNAWIRWKIWKKKYDQTKKQMFESQKPMYGASEYKILSELDRTRKFFDRFYPKGLKKPEILEMIQNGNLRRWIALDKVSPYFVVISPTVSSQKFSDRYWTIDMDLYRRDVNEKTRRYFQEIFPGDI